MRVLVKSFGANLEAVTTQAGHGSHHHAPAPFVFKSKFAEGVLEIIETPAGERMQLKTMRAAVGLIAEVSIQREAGSTERLSLRPLADDPSRLVSEVAPRAPHQFKAAPVLRAGEEEESLPFTMTEPDSHE